MARDHGVHGVIYPITERDPIQLIQQKLKIIEGNGELERRNTELQKKARASVERPKPVEGITRAAQPRIFYYDPTYVVKEDFKDHQGRVFASKGLKLNPLETVSLSQNLIFFNGNDKQQVAWIKERLLPSAGFKKLKLILIQGAPLKLAEELGMPIYFDQSGVLTQKLGIHHIPAIVSQEGLRLKIEEVAFPSGESKTEGVP